MSRQDWSDAENDMIVADYFAMLAEDISGRPYSKAKHRRLLALSLASRSEGSIEFKHQNISAVLKALGEGWITGYMHFREFHLGDDTCLAVRHDVQAANRFKSPRKDMECSDPIIK